jgi:NAD(P)-dependent dehydrogenase (short-subunit alcohol dehydrogenase family)
MTDKLFPDGAALVVGGSGGVGRAVCLEFARAGADVAITYQKKGEVAEKLAADIRSLGRKATVLTATFRTTQPYFP